VAAFFNVSFPFALNTSLVPPVVCGQSSLNVSTADGIAGLLQNCSVWAACVARFVCSPVEQSISLCFLQQPFMCTVQQNTGWYTLWNNAKSNLRIVESQQLQGPWDQA